MKKLVYLVWIMTAIVFTSCHTETPTAVDLQPPKTEMLMVYNDSDTLFNAADTSMHATNFTTENYKIKVHFTDNDKVYQIKLMAKDVVSNKLYQIAQINYPLNNIIDFIISYRDFPAVQDSLKQTFELYAKVIDESELMGTSPEKLKFKIPKETPLEAFHRKFGLLTEVDSLKTVDFSQKVGKVAFIQFLGWACISCFDEAVDLNNFYNSNEFDSTKCYIATIGSSPMADMDITYIRQKKMEVLGHQPKVQDFFLDNINGVSQPLDTFFDNLVGIDNSNAVYAVLPSGVILQYTYNYVFSEWVTFVYNKYKPLTKLQDK